MIQQIIALVIILYFVSRLLWQKKKKEITGAEFVFWLAFWLIAAVAVILIKEIDRFVASMGFSGSGIDVLLYLGIALLFYLIFRMRLRIARMENDITKVVREIAVKK